jgi:hypothetical protein
MVEYVQVLKPMTDARRTGENLNSYFVALGFGISDAIQLVPSVVMKLVLLHVNITSGDV